MKKIMIVVLGVVVGFSCSEIEDQQFDDLQVGQFNLNDSTAVGSENVINKALEIIDGRVDEVSTEYEHGFAAWKVEIITDTGAEVEFYFRKDNDELLRIDGEKGPYDYFLDPGHQMITFGEAKEVGDEYMTGKVEEWRLERDEDYYDIWVYEIEYSSPDGDIEINAISGDVLDVQF